jgi:hypothetical protein
VIRSDLKRIHLVPHGVCTSRGVRGGDSRKAMRARPLGSRHSPEEGQEISREAGRALASRVRGRMVRP